MNAEKPLIKQRMVVIPLPPNLRVSSNRRQFPTLYVYSDSIELNGTRIPMASVCDLRRDQCGIRFATCDKDYWYAAQSYDSKECPCEEVTASLFELLCAVKDGNANASAAAVDQLRSKRRSLRFSMWIAAVITIGIAILFAIVSGL